jgi:CHAT domain-containing protein
MMLGAEELKLRKYLLGQLTEAEEEQIEMRLLSEPDFADEHDIVVNEVTDDYVAGSFEGEELEQVEQYFFKSTERQQKLKFALALKARKSESGADSKRLWFMPYLAIAASLVIAAGGFYVWRMQSNDSELNKGLAALQSAYREQRPFEARISRLNYAPYSITRGPGTDKIDQDELRRAELTFLDAVKKNPTPAVHHGLGKVFLAKKDFDKAIKEFDEALKGDPRNAQLYSDLGVVWLEKGKIDLDKGKAEPTSPAAGKGMEELGRSLENLNKALELDPNMLEALFNRALSRQYQTLYTQAATDWRDYLTKDSSSPWAVEATQNLKLIEEKKFGGSSEHNRPLNSFLRAYRAGDDHAAWEVYRRGYTSSGNSISEGLIDSFLRENTSANSSNTLPAIHYLGQLQTRNTGDTYNADLARVYGSASPEIRALLLQAREQMSKGYELFMRSRITDSMELFSGARTSFNAAGSGGEALLAEYAIAHGATIQPDLEKSKQIFARIIPISEAKGYKWVLAQCLTERAHLQANLNNYSESIDDSNKALRLSEEIQDENGTVGSFIQLASLYLFLNDSEKSLSFVQRGITRAENERTAPTQLWGMYIAAAFNFNNLHINRAALDYQREALSIALDSQIPLYISRSYQYSGLSYGNLGAYDEALKNVRRAYEQGLPLAGEPNGQNMMANASLKLGDLYRASGDRAQAIAAYDESIRLYEGLGFAHYSYAAHKGKLLSYLAENNDVMAAQELAFVLTLFEGYREKILEERQRNFYFDKEQDVYDLAIDFAYSRAKDQRRSFEYSETSRARSLLDLLRHGGLVVELEGGSELRMPPQVAESLPLDKIQELMPDAVQLLQYAILKDKVIIWVITKSDFSTKTTDIDSKKLADDVARSLKLISSGDESEAATALKGLYEILIKPVESLLNQKKVLCIVPDKDLNYVPFAGLLSGKSGRYLVQDYQLMLSPSASVFIHCSMDAKEKAANKTERLLAVGNPSFDRQAYSQYANLAAAEREAEGVAALYHSPGVLARVLIGGRATVGAVKAELERSDVAHLAAHYVIDPQSSLSSRLLLAKPESNDGQRVRETDLESRDVCRMNLSRTRLVVLSACQSGIERQYSGEGPTSFARQFIVAGVPLIVASLWPVDSEATAQLMIAFHRYRKTDQLTTAEALRRAQEQMIASNDARYRRPYYWASFAVIGGYAEF